MVETGAAPGVFVSTREDPDDGADPGAPQDEESGGRGPEAEVTAHGESLHGFGFPVIGLERLDDRLSNQARRRPAAHGSVEPSFLSAEHTPKTQSTNIFRDLLS